MNEPTRSALATELGAVVPPFLDDLEDAEATDLATALADARTAQAAAVEEAIDKALGYVPWVVRGAVRKVLLG